MADQVKSIKVQLKTIADINDALGNIDKLQKALSVLKLPDQLKTSFTKIFSDAEKYGTKAAEALSTGFKTKGEVSTYAKNIDGLCRSFDQLVRNMDKIDQNILEETFKNNIDPNELKRINDEISKLQQSLESIRANKFQEVNKVITDTNNRIKSSAQSWQNFENSIKSGDLEGARKALQNLHNGLNRINTDTEEGKQKYEVYRDALGVLEGKLNELTESGSEYQNILEQINNLDLEKSGLSARAIEEAAEAWKDTTDQANRASVEVNKFGDETKDAAGSQQELNSELDQFKHRITYFFGMANAVNLFKRAVRAAFETVKDLDKVMTQTAVVTEFDVSDMWSQLPEYTKRANELGVSIHDAYEAATLYYQQGLKTNEVMAVSNETLKMARIAGLDAATATDRMTNALRGFNMTITEANAQNVNDVYSKLAAITASNTDEISTAMTKVASLAHNANMEFETTAAFLAQIIETTRESAETAGTALKTVVARFSEVKKLYSEGDLLGSDEEGEAIDVNKVSAALRTAGINLNEYLTGMKGLDDIFIELSSKWNNLSIVQQRYIATMAAGSRQQSRFIALMSDYARTTELVNAATNASGASQEQFNKTLESLDSKLNQLKNAWNSFLMSIADSDAIKFVVDALTKIISAINSMTSGLGKLSGVVKLVFGVVLFKAARAIFDTLFTSIGAKLKGKANESGRQTAAQWAAGFKAGIQSNGGGIKGVLTQIFTKEVSISSERTQKYVNELNAALEKSTQFGPNEYEKLSYLYEQEGFKAFQKEVEASGRSLEGLSVGCRNFTGTSKKLALDLNKVGSAAMMVGGAITMLGQALDNGTESGKRLSQSVSKIGTIIMGVGMAVTTLGGLFKVLGITITTEGIKAQAAWSWIGLILTAVAALTVGIIAWVSSLETTEQKVTRLEEEAKKASQAAEEAQNKYDELLSNQNQYNDLIKEVENLTEGTTAWKEAIAKVNEQTLKLLATYKILSQYVNIDNNGMMFIKEEGWSNLLEQQAAIAQEYKRKSIGKDIETYNAKRVLLEEDLQKKTKNKYVEGYSLSSKDMEDTASFLLSKNRDYGDNKFLFKMGQLADTKEFWKDYEQYVSDTKELDRINKGVITQIIGTKYAGNEYYNSLVSMFENLPVEQLDEAAYSIFDKYSFALDEAADTLQEKFEGLTGLDYDSIAKEEEIKDKDRGKDLAKRLKNLKVQGYILDSVESIVKNTNDTVQKVLKKDLNIDTEQAEQEIEKLGLSQGAKKALLAGLSEIGSRKIELDNRFKNIFGATIPESGVDYNKANDLISAADILGSSSIVGSSITEILGNVGIDQVSDLIDSIKDINFSSAIDGAYELGNLIKDNNPVVAEFAKTILIADQGFYSATSQVNEFYKSLTDETLKDLLKDNNISADEIRSLAKENEKLQRVLDNTGVSAGTLAVYYDKVAKGELDIAANSSGFIEALEKSLTVENAIADAFATIANFKAGNSITQIHSFVEDTKKKFKELYELGAYNDQAIIDYEKLLFGEEGFENLKAKYGGNMKKIADEANKLLESTGSNFYGFWKKFAQLGGENNPFTVLSNGILEVDTSKIESIEQLLSDVSTQMGVSKEVAQMAFTDLQASSATLRQELDKLAASQALSTFLKHGIVINDIIHYDKKQLKVLADQIGADVEDLITEIQKTLDDSVDFSNLDELINPDNELYESLKEGIATKIEEGLEEGIDLTNEYQFLIKAGMDTSQAAATVGQLFKDAAAEFNDIPFAFDPNTLKITEAIVGEDAEYAGEKNREEVSEGVVEAYDNPEIGLQQEITAKKQGLLIAKAVKDGIITGLFVPVDQFLGTDMVSKLKAAGDKSLKNEYEGKIDELKDQLAKFKEETSSTVNESAQERINKLIDEYLAKLKKATAYTTETARTLGEKTEDAKDDAKETASIYENTYTELYNLNQSINEEIRQRTKLERRYQAVLADENSTLADVRKAYRDQIESLVAQKELLQQKADVEQRMLDNAGSRFYGEGDARKTFAEWKDPLSGKNVTQYAEYKNGRVHVDWEGLDQVKDSDFLKASEAYIKLLEEHSDGLEEAIDGIDDCDYDIKELNDDVIQTYASFEERVMDAYISMKEEEIDALEEESEAINDSNSKIISKLQEQISEQRQARKNAQTEQEIASKEARLAYLRRDTSNANQLEILQLEKELEEQRQDYSDELVDQAIDRMQKEADYAAQQRASQIQVMRDQLEEQKKTGALWDEVHALIRNSVGEDGKVKVDSELVKLLEQTDGYKGMSELGKKLYHDKLQADIDEALVGAGLANKKYDNDISGVGDTPEGQVTTNKNTPKSTGTTTSTATTAPATTATTTATTQQDKLTDYYKAGVALATINGLWGHGETRKENFRSVGLDPTEMQQTWINPIYNKSTGKWNERKYEKEYGISQSELKTKFSIDAIKKLVSFSTGGLANFTGPAWLDGSRSNPELVLSAVDTRNFLALRDVLAKLLNNGSIEGGGDAYYDIDINAEIGSDYDVDRLAARIEKKITDSSSYRNVNTMNFIR